MFSKLKTLAAATAVAGAVALGGAATASAGTAVVTGGGAVHATSPSARLVVNNAVALNCASSSATATVNNGTYTGTPAIVSTNVQIAFVNGATTCVGPAGFLFNVVCTNTANLGVTGNTVSGVTPGRIGNINCVVNFPAIPCSASVTGTVDGAYNNAGTITVNGTYAQNLTVSGSTCPGVIPNGSAKFGGTGSTPLALTSLTYTLTNTGGFVRPQVAATGF